MINDKIEVFILTYNRANYLETAIRSVLNQTVQTKLTVVDNHSSDTTPDLVKRLKAEGAVFSYVRRSENGGYLGNLETAKECFSYPYVVLFHDDDAMHPQYMESALRIMEQEKEISLLCSSFVDFKNVCDLNHKRNTIIKYKLIHSTGLFASYVFSSHILNPRESLSYPSVIYRKDLILSTKGRRDLYGKLDDGPFVIECSHGGNIVQITTPLVCIRRHPGQDSHDSATACTIEQIFNGNTFYKSYMRERSDTLNLFWMICGRHLKAHSNFGNGTFRMSEFVRRAFYAHQLKVRSLLLVLEYAIQRVLRIKCPLLLHRYLWRKTCQLFEERCIMLEGR